MNLKIENGEIVEGLDDFRTRLKDSYMVMMIEALARVSKDYITYGMSYHVERTYVCELYHQWRKILERSKNNSSQLCLNAEPSKHIQIESHKEIWKFPDMILHHSQVDNNDNRIACEFKRQGWSEDGFDKDMKTLNYLLTRASDDSRLKYNFKWGVFVQIGGTIENIRNYVRHHSFNENIWCIVVDNEATQLTIQSIGDLMSYDKCDKCGDILPDSANFCPKCGESVKGKR